MSSQQATKQQIQKVSKLGGSALVREFGKLAKIDNRFDLDSDIEIKDQLLAALETDFAIENQNNNLSDQANDQANDQAVVTAELAPASDIDVNEPVGTGLAGHNKTELFYWPQHERYCIKPYDEKVSISKEQWESISFCFHKLTDFPKSVIAKAAKVVEVKPTKYYAQFAITYSFESLTDLNGKTFNNLTELEDELKSLGVEYECAKGEEIVVKRLHGQRPVGTTGNTKGGLSDPFERADASIPVSKEQIKFVKQGSNTHLALLALQQGINIKDKSEAAIASLQSLADSNNCETINPEQFSWKFRQAALLNGYGYELTAPNTYKLVLPEGLDTIKVK